MTQLGALSVRATGPTAGTLGTLAQLGLTLYLLALGSTIWHLGWPAACRPDDPHCLRPAVRDAVHAAAFVSPSRRFSERNVSNAVWSGLHIAGAGADGELVVPIPDAVRLGRSTDLYCHLVVAPAHLSEALDLSSPYAALVTAQLVRYYPAVAQGRARRNLLDGAAAATATASAPASDPGALVPHLVHFRHPLVARFVVSGASFARPFLQDGVRLEARPKGLYAPLAQFDEISVRRAHAVPLSSNTSFPDPAVAIRVVPCSLLRFRLSRVVATMLEYFDDHVFSNGEIDEIRCVGAATSTVPLSAT
jgi:hypothetical protein